MIAATPDQLDAVVFGADGLVPAIVQESGTGQVLMMAWMSPESLRLTLEEGRTVFWSRSRQELWRKGETSGEVQRVREAFYDCDGDTLLFVVDQEGDGACHTGALLLLPPLWRLSARGGVAHPSQPGRSSPAWPPATRSCRCGPSCWPIWRHR